MGLNGEKIHVGCSQPKKFQDKSRALVVDSIRIVLMLFKY